MSTPSIAKSRNLKTAASKKRNVKSSATARRKVTSAATTAKAPPKSDKPKVERVTSRSACRVRSDLASIVEVSEQPFRPEDGGELGPDALDVERGSPSEYAPH
jgi:hypothetical protein